jgi:hypothetical protein
MNDEEKKALEETIKEQQNFNKFVDYIDGRVRHEEDEDEYPEELLDDEEEEEEDLFRI